MYRYKRSERVQELILEEISKLIQFELKDPRIGFVTVTHIDLTSNLKHAKVFVSIMGDTRKKDESLLGLESAKGFIRGQLGKRLYLKAIPELDFKLDTTAEKVEKITKIIREIHEEEDEEAKEDKDE